MGFLKQDAPQIDFEEWETGEDRFDKRGTPHSNCGVPSSMDPVQELAGGDHGQKKLLASPICELAL